MVVLDHAREHGNLGEPRGADAERHPARAKRLWRVLGVRAGRSRAWAGGVDLPTSRELMLMFEVDKGRKARESNRLQRMWYLAPSNRRWSSKRFLFMV